MPDDTRFKISRPTFLVDNREDGELANRLLSMTVAEDTAGLFRCEAVFGNWGEKNGKSDFIYFDRQKLDFGKAFQVKLGDDPIFVGRIMALEGRFASARPPEIVVLAEDRFQDLRMTRRTRTFEQVSDSDLFNQVASDHGLTPQIDVSGPTHKVLAQVNQSDLAFLRERARAVDAELWMDDSTLHVQARGNRNGGTIQIGFGNQLREFNVLADLAHQRTSVSVSGWDVSGKQAIKHEAPSSIMSSELGSDTDGASILSGKLAARKEQIAHAVPITAAEAQARAEAIFKMGARRFVTGFGVAETNGKMRVGTFLDLQGLGPLFSGKYYLSDVKHLFDGKNGLRTEFVGERPGLGQP